VELAAFAVWCFLVAFAGGLVGLVLGNLRLPATLVVADSAAAGTGANLAISAAAAATASIAHVRAGRVNWKLFAWMAPPSIATAFAGGYLSGEAPRDFLLSVICGVLLYSAYELLRPRERPTAAPAPASGGPDYLAAALTGALIGLLGGFVGLILGSLRMPALLRIVGETPHRAVGTNVLVGFLVGVAGALGHLPSEAPDTSVLVIGAAASVPGALLGSRLTGRLSEPQLIRAIGWVLVLAAAGVIADIAVGS
jgi:uncharacterized membrane protein YfcA